jgi:hypothetical protein
VRVLRATPAAASRKSGVALLVRNYEFLQQPDLVASKRTDDAMDADTTVPANEHRVLTGSLR